MTRLAIFDLDGTLLNTIGDLAVSCNAVLALRGLPQHSYEDYCRFVGNGIMRLVERALPEALRTPYTVDVVRRDFVAYYLAHICDNTVPYPGIPELLAALKRDGVNVGIVSNKKNEATRLICEKLLGGLYDYAHGAANEEERKPKPDMVYDAMAHFGASKDETVYVGDSNVDIETAWNAGIDCISVTWGYRDKAALEKAGATAFAEDAKQLPALLKAL